MGYGIASPAHLPCGGSPLNATTELPPALADQVERVVREAFVYAFDGAMVLCTLVSVAGLIGSFLVARGAPQNKQAG